MQPAEVGGTKELAPCLRLVHVLLLPLCRMCCGPQGCSYYRPRRKNCLRCCVDICIRCQAALCASPGCYICCSTSFASQQVGRRLAALLGKCRLYCCIHAGDERLWAHLHMAWSNAVMTSARRVGMRTPHTGRQKKQCLKPGCSKNMWARSSEEQLLSSIRSCVQLAVYWAAEGGQGQVRTVRFMLNLMARSQTARFSSPRTALQLAASSASFSELRGQDVDHTQRVKAAAQRARTGRLFAPERQSPGAAQHAGRADQPCSRPHPSFPSSSAVHAARVHTSPAPAHSVKSL